MENEKREFSLYSKVDVKMEFDPLRTTEIQTEIKEEEMAGNTSIVVEYSIEQIESNAAAEIKNEEELNICDEFDIGNYPETFTSGDDEEARIDSSDSTGDYYHISN